MKLYQLEVRDFRNLEKLTYCPAPGLNILVGDNAQGKTNILEVLYLLSTGASFRTGPDKNLVKYEKEACSVRGNYSCAGRTLEASLRYNIKEGKTYSLNSKKTTFANPLRLRVVLFTPDDLFLIKGGPGKRRDFLDFILIQTKKEYAYNLTNYGKILKKRNSLLKKEHSNNSSFKIIEEIYIDNAARLILARINLINTLDEYARFIYQTLSNQEQLKIRYALSFPFESGKINLDTLKEALAKQLQEKRGLEIRRKSSLVGPHRDDLNIYLNGKNARYFASQGQQRNIAVALKLAEIDTFRQICGFNPLFLLDEVLAELDKGKREKLLEYLQKADFQSFLTSVNLTGLDCSQALIATVQNGRLRL